MKLHELFTKEAERTRSHPMKGRGTKNKKNPARQNVKVNGKKYKRVGNALNVMKNN